MRHLVALAVAFSILGVLCLLNWMTVGDPDMLAPGVLLVVIAVGLSAVIKAIR